MSHQDLALILPKIYKEQLYAYCFFLSDVLLLPEYLEEWVLFSWMLMLPRIIIKIITGNLTYFDFIPAPFSNPQGK